MTSVTVDFYDQFHGAVSFQGVINTNRSQDETTSKFISSLLFACFALRNFANLNKHPIAYSLGVALTTWSPQKFLKEFNTSPSSFPIGLKNPALDAALHMGMNLKTAMEKYGAPLILEKNKGKGKRQIIGRLLQTSDAMLFRLSLKGFPMGGMFGNPSQHASNAVLLILTQLYIMFPKDPAYETQLKSIANACTEHFYSGRLTTFNQEELAVQIVKSYL